MTIELGNAAGTCKTLEDVRRLARSAVDVITLGSITVEYREGNPGTNHYQDEVGTSINSLGLPNLGSQQYYCNHLSAMREFAEKEGKQLSVSLAILQESDLEALTRLLSQNLIKIIELNAGCPNVWSGSKQKRILSFDPIALDTTIGLLVRLAPFAKEIRVKLSPYSDPGLLAEVASMLQCHPVTLVTSNTFANAFMFQDSSFVPAIPFGKHLGGMAGMGMKPIVLGQVVQFRELLPQHKIIAVGEVNSGRDMFEYERVGANGVQIGTAYYFSENPRIFSDVLSQYVDFLDRQSSNEEE